MSAAPGGPPAGGAAQRFECGAPVDVVDTGSDHDGLAAPQPGIALCLSGGGYRAMLFHLGAMRTHVDAALPAPGRFPYPHAGV